jgi:peptide/nickel transport system substrate-binding protein
MIKKLIPVVVVVSFLSACSGCGGGHQGPNAKQAKGGVYYGGSFRLNEVANFRSLFPLDVGDLIADNIDVQIYEGLVKLAPKDLTIVPCLAEKWTHNDSATLWTFYIRKGVKFQDDECFQGGKGRDVTASDFKWCFDQLCTASPQNSQYLVTFKGLVQGAEECYQLTASGKPLPAGGVSGVKVIDDNTLQIKLNRPAPNFLDILCMPGCWLFPKEALAKYGKDIRIHCVGTGPFQIKEVQEEQAIVLQRNPHYWDVDENGNQLPYLESVKFTFVKEKRSELLEFQQDNLEMMYQIPIEIIPQILGDISNPNQTTKVDYNLQATPALYTYFYGFQTQNKVFNNKYLRQAINYAIDRDKIVTYTLQGEGIPGDYGLVPPMPGYNFKDVKGYTFNPDKAKEMLAKAGYPNGKGLGEITLETNPDGGNRNVQIAEVVKKMLEENLNIQVKIEAVPFPQHLDAFERGKIGFFRESWSADYPDPQTFLSLLYGPNVPKDSNERANANPMRFKNAKFDSLFAAATVCVSDSMRMKLYEEADQAAIDEAPYLCIFYDENYYLLHNYVKNFYGNAMDYRDLSKVYLIPPDKRNPNNGNASPNPMPQQGSN